MKDIIHLKSLLGSTRNETKLFTSSYKKGRVLMSLNSCDAIITFQYYLFTDAKVQKRTTEEQHATSPYPSVTRSMWKSGKYFMLTGGYHIFKVISTEPS